MTNEFNNLYEFADFRFDGTKSKLWCKDELILLSPKASELLHLLLEKNGGYVSKEEIFEKIWADTFVEDGVLTQNIYTLRKALGKVADGQQIIENKTRLGYRITTPVSKIEQTDGNSLEISETSQYEEGLSARAKQPKRSWKKPALVLAAVLLLLLPLAFFASRLLRPKIASMFRQPIEKVKFSKLTNTGDLTNAVISPDGTMIAFTRGDNIFLKDVLTEKEIKLDIPNDKSFSSLQFSPDGNFLYFRNNRILATQAAIVKVSRFGGETEKIIERSWGSFSLSPDSKQIAYFLNVPPIAKFNLIIRNLETGEEKEFLAAEQPENVCGVCAPAWSPDGKKIIFTVNVPTGNGKLFAVNLENDQKSEIKLEKLRRFEQVTWFPDSESFVVSASDGSRILHLWKVYYPDGETQPVTNGLSAYGRVSISSDGRKLLALQTDEISNLYVSEAENLAESKQLTFGNQNSYGQNGLHWIDDGRILFSIQTEQDLVDNLAVLNIADGSKTILTNEKRESFRVPVSDGKNIWFAMNKDGSAQIFQMDIDGKNIRQLTDGNDGQRISPRVTNDSKYLYYVVRGKTGATIRRFDLQTNTEEMFFNNPEYQPGPFLEISPDNKYLTFLRLMERPENADPKFNAMMTVVSIEKPDDIKTFPVSFVPPIRRFSPDSQALDWIYAATDATQIVRQGFKEPEPKPIYTAPDGKIFNFAWSKDGKKLVVAKGQQFRDAVLLTEFHE